MVGIKYYIHLSLNKHGWPNLTQNEHKMKKNRTNYYRYNRIKAKMSFDKILPKQVGYFGARFN
jgi:hypothetical protein